MRLSILLLYVYEYYIKCPMRSPSHHHDGDVTVACSTLLLHKDKAAGHWSHSIEAQQPYATGDDKEVLGPCPFMLLSVISLQWSNSNARRRLNLLTSLTNSRLELQKESERLKLWVGQWSRAVHWPAVIQPTPSSNRFLCWFWHGHHVEVQNDPNASVRM